MGSQEDIAAESRASSQDLAEIYGLLGRTEKAAEHLRKLLDMNPGDHWARVELARAQKRLGLPGQMEETLRADQGWQLDADLARTAHMELGEAFLAQGRIDEAAAEYRKVIEAAPGFAAPHEEIAKIYALKGMAAEARRELDLARDKRR